ncbi:GcrA family cell cycle regulator [Govanella unica]|uniref:GcrA family cell cycle regulator n=1 Tax=Govanella unica TaxID=2975056 RepID=A0A9X3TZF1_9PROT|nr:GcrA family cell cycle regulator [Govania unica]MDA5194796.1 GcrA family cell cycle regulator [Govania unica]
MSWTDDRIGLLKELWEKGLSASQIATELGGVTRNAVIGKAHRMGLSSRPSPVKADTAKQASTTAARPAAPKKQPEKKAVKQRVTLLDLTDRMCKWPFGHPGDADFHFCGKQAEQTVPYCAEHCAQAYQAQTSRRDRRISNQRRVMNGPVR